MASLRLKLSPLKVIIRPTRGKVQKNLVYRDDGSFTRPSHAVAAATAAGDVDDNVECSSQIQDEAFCEGPSLHRPMQPRGKEFGISYYVPSWRVKQCPKISSVSNAMMWLQICNVGSVILQPSIAMDVFCQLIAPLIYFMFLRNGRLV